jgi:hypothetical protein
VSASGNESLATVFKMIVKPSSATANITKQAVVDQGNNPAVRVLFMVAHFGD